MKVAYSGLARGEWKGAFTCQRYPFSPDRRAGWVDKRDAPEMLAFRTAEGDAVFSEVMA